MPPLLELIAEREAAATAAADTLRKQTAKPSDELALAEVELAITRKTLTRLTGRAEAAEPVDATIAGRLITHTESV